MRMLAAALLLLSIPAALAETPAEQASRLLGARLSFDRAADQFREVPRDRSIRQASLQPGVTLPAPTERPLGR